MNEAHSHHVPSQRGLENRTTANMRLITATRLPAICGVSLASDTVIPTPDGWTTLADIRPGERVFDERGQPCTVTQVSAETVELVYRVTFCDSSDIVTGADHPWMTLTHMDLCPVGRSMFRPGPWRAGCWPVTTHELEQLVSKHPDMQTNALHYVPVASVLDIPEKDLPVHPWLLGCVDILVMMLVCQMLSCQQNNGTGFSISCVAAPACMSLRKKIASDLSRLCCGLTAPAPNGGCFRPNTGIGTVSINDSPVGLTKASGSRCFNISPATRTWNT